ncbi:hypothetical protein [Succinimonas sp.]
MRSPGYYQNYASLVNTGGALYPHGDLVCNDGNAVRPALRLIWNL